jgi:hypothetical protein
MENWWKLVVPIYVAREKSSDESDTYLLNSNQNTNGAEIDISKAEKS